MTEANGNGFTQKEMLVRIDGKLDMLAGRVVVLEVESAVGKAERAAQAERDKGSEEWRDEMRAELLQLKANDERQAKRIAYASGILATLVILANWFLPKLLEKV